MGETNAQRYSACQRAFTPVVRRPLIGRISLIAAGLGHGVIAPEHILMGLCWVTLSGPAQYGESRFFLRDMFGVFRISPKAALDAAQQRAPRGSDEVFTGMSPLGPKCLPILETALSLSQRNAIGCEELLLALLCENEGLVAEILATRLDSARLQQALTSSANIVEALRKMLPDSADEQEQRQDRQEG